LRAIATARREEVESAIRQTEASIVDQQRRCHEYAASRSWPVVADFTDEGISGAALGNRPGFQQVMSKRQASDVLLPADLTRLSGSQELAPLLDRLRFRGVRIIGVLDGFDSDSPQARMQAGLSGLMSDELRAGIRVRTHSELQMRAMAGRPTGGKVYGYDSGGQMLENEGSIVREIFQRFAPGELLRPPPHVGLDQRRAVGHNPLAFWPLAPCTSAAVGILHPGGAIPHDPSHIAPPCPTLTGR
jgi:site-specific DNA recombinase